ncbi:E-beta-farnesene synthase [Artemisia annua]|uniref:E-beta-farnesene synthase n=1 Tax=Artemisia annua TaxID=35608 RepID=A0A2U1KG65_ARTAN|nr:E-beta-farnesene synthase [Artemisia annua]
MSSIPVYSASSTSSSVLTSIGVNANTVVHMCMQTEDLVVEKQLVDDLTQVVKIEVIRITTSSHESMQHTKLIQLIDAVQRLGIAYHFEEEIEEALQHIYGTYGEQWIDKNNLESTSLWFRLLRQHGFNVSPGDGTFKEALCNDAQGTLALYEAAYMRVEGEQVLDKPLEFTKIHLDIISKDPSCDSSLRTQIQQALTQPLRRSLARLEALRYILIYQQETSHNEVLLKLAKLDFNVLQSMHKKELSQICK